ncbi:MAG: MMPL family transporter [Bacteroidia bacterium]|nr:MMPL family transporter [Bacteroidia bacterium]
MNPVWQAIARFIIRKRIPILIVLGILVAYMWSVRATELVQRVADIILSDEAELEGYNKLKEHFGDDATVMVVSLDGDIFEYERFSALYDLTEELEQIDGVENVISLTKLYDIVKDTARRGFALKPIVATRPSSQTEVDSIAQRIRELFFYEGLILNDSTQTSLLAVSFNGELLDTDFKIPLFHNTKEPILRYAEKFNIEPRFAGMPVLRVNMHENVKRELFLFLALALIVTAISLLLFFRSFYNMVFPLLVVGSVIIFSVGLIGLFGYKMSLITGIIPALITVISIPNCVYLVTKYHIEFKRTGNKLKSLILVIEKIGIVTVMTNATTAVGLGVLAFTDIKPLQEFGVVAGLSVVAAFFISLLLIPIVFSFLPPPTEMQTKHLERRSLGFIIKSLKNIVDNHRSLVYVVTAILVVFSLWGMSRVQPISYIADDVPEDSKILQDLRYIENRFNGTMPFEILIDTKKKNGVIRRRNLQLISQLQDSLSKYDDLSRSISVADFSKFFNQAFFEGNPIFYELPSRHQYPMIRDYVRKTDVFDNEALSKSLTDDDLQLTRVSASVRDIGSLEMKRLADSVRKDVAAIFDEEQYDTYVTGTSQIFIKANEALIENLLWSLLLAFIVIAIIMGLLFKSLRMVLISLVPNILPLLMVAGVMGFTGIHLKPSTALVFGVAFGIAVDDSIHFLARFRLARKLGDSVRGAVRNSFQDTGVSMIYTSIILFFGFVSFTASDFGGTKSLGLLTSMTLGIAMFSNLLILPSLLITFSQEEKQDPEAELEPFFS